MKINIILLILIPQMVYSQYLSKAFTLNTEDIMGIALKTTFSNADSIIKLNNPPISAGLFISGEAFLDNNIDSYVRIIMNDITNIQYLVYEVYPLLAETTKCHFSKIGLETAYLDKVKPESLIIETFKATVFIDSIYCVDNHTSVRKFSNSISNRKLQCEEIAYLLNKRLVDENKTWRAGLTNISQLTFEEKKDLFGGKVPVLYGFDYYKNGVFTMPNWNTLTSSKVKSSSKYVDEWDWRNRHGKNWLTPVKNQTSCASCWAFAAIGAFESYINLYYNKLLNYDLSEQELISCSNAGNCNGGFLSKALDYIKSSGSVLEECFEYTATNNTCNNKCTNPANIFSFENNASLYINNEDSLKKNIIKSPVCCTIPAWWHCLVIAGFKQIDDGESFFASNGSKITIPAESPLIGHSAWLFKNSWGADWGDNGYGYMAITPEEFGSFCVISGNVYSKIYTTKDVCCVDRDGDGYYNWGIGIKPTSCPIYAPNEADGDDSDYTKGPLDEYGNLKTINPNIANTLVIKNDTIFSTRNYIHQHIVLRNRSLLKITNEITCYQGVKIVVEKGSTLTVSNGILRDVILDLKPGSKLQVINNGKIIHNKSSNFYIQPKVMLQYDSGIIE